MKRCFKCLCEKPLEAFYRHAMMGDGHLNKCKDCTKKDVAEHRQANLEAVRKYDRMRGSMPHRLAQRRDYANTSEGRAKARAANRAYVARYPEKKPATVALNNAVRDGRIFRWPVCEVPECSDTPEAHHPHYGAPLLVTWLCKRHHMEAHKMANEAAREAA
jgi:hypothetical protein